MIRRIHLRHLRKLALVGSGLTFGTIALIGIVAPHTVAGVYGLSLVGIEGLNEFRAVYTGFWISLCVAMLTAARRPDETLLGDVCGVMLLMQSLGRFTSFALDGRPSWLFVAVTFAELGSAMMVLAPRLLARPVAAST
jgi:hypothetical protein